jgi:nucleoside-diphosphate-sugar epimerase
MADVLIIGCGDIGRRIAAHGRTAGASIAGLVRSAHARERLAAAGIAPVVGDLDLPATLAELPSAGALLYYLAPPPASGTSDPRVEALLDALAGREPRRMVYVSTTGVYGDCGGAWITEEQPLRPGSDRARRRVAAEQALRGWGEAAGVAVVVLRVPAIYGPGRLPIERLRRGDPVLREEESPYTNRIHSEDLARVCMAAAERGRAGGIYNVSDGHPTSMTEYFLRVADLLGLPRPPIIAMEEARERLSAEMLSYLRESRRIDNTRMREELGVELLYPDLEAGLAACA